MLTGAYEFLPQDRVIFGRPAAEAVSDTLDKLGCKRAYIVSSNTLHTKTDVIDAISKRLGDRCAGVFSSCIEHVPRESALELARILRKEKPDLVVTVGGGTPVDTVKVALALLAENIDDVSGFDSIRIRVNEKGERVVPTIGMPPMRQIIVPTTLSGAEFSMLGGSTDRVRQVKDLYMGRYIGSQVVILDPAITVHTPEALWLSTGVRAIDHAVETVCSRAPQPFTDGTCLYALQLLGRSLRLNRAEPGNLEARLDSQLAVWLATTGLGRIDWGASHGIGHQLGAVANVPHGYCSCVMLPSVLRYNAGVGADRQRLVSRALGDENKSAAELVGKLIADLGMPTTLRDVGVRRDQFEAIGNGAMQNMMVRSNPRKIDDPSQVKEILEMAW